MTVEKTDRQTDRQIDRKYVSNKETKIRDTGKSEK